MDHVDRDINRLLQGDHSEDGATQMLHAIQAGGQNILIIARRRTSEMLDKIDEGDFAAAASLSKAVTSTLAPLANAQTYIAVADNARLVKARDLEPGMVLSDIGEITEIDVEECGVEGCHGHVTIKLGEHEIEFGGEVELYVAPPDADG